MSKKEETDDPQQARVSERTADTKQQISKTLKEYNMTEKGKQTKAAGFVKRSNTLTKEREELRRTMTHKLCTHKNCANKDKLQPTTAFSKKTEAKDGLQPYCKLCINTIKSEKRKEKHQL